MSAARRAPAQANAERIQDKLRLEAENLGLNAVSIAREGWTRFLKADRFLKYKLLVVASWVVLSTTGVFVACPGSGRSGNSLGAHLTLAGDESSPVFMVRNESTRVWEDVLVIVNGEYRLSVAKIAPGKDVTFGPKQLVGENGRIPPRDLRILDIELRSEAGTTMLMEQGKPPEE